MPTRLRFAALTLALLSVPASAEAGTLLSVPAAGGRPTQVGSDAGGFFNTPCGRADGTIIARVEGAESSPRYGLVVVAAAPECRVRRLIEPVRDLSPPISSTDGTAIAVARRG